MSQVLYDLYLADVMKLSRTLVVKSAASADILNSRIVNIGHSVDTSDPSSWKYYLNLAGIYHYLDEAMTVKSLDTLNDIAFTKENLLVHRATAKAYAYGTPYYRTLVEKFPKQEQLISGILNPVDLTTAINAADATILWYDKTLVEANESNLIPKLQEFTTAWWRTYNSPAYDLAHDLYTAGLHASFYTALLGQVLGIRLDNCHTQYAHSFHIWSYLSGKGRLDEFEDYLTTNQTLWLYRNIDYINSTVGQNSTNELLVEHLMTERGFPIVAYDLLQNVSGMPDALVPTVDCLAIPLNFTDKTPAERQTTTVAELVEKEIPLARENSDYTAEHAADVTDWMTYSQITRVPTRVMESKVVDRSDSNHVTLAEVLLNHWLYLSQVRRYNAVITFADPQTGDAYNMSVKDAFVLWIWLFNRALDRTMTTIPTATAKRVRKLTLPTPADLRAITRPAYVPDWLIELYYENQPSYGLVVSTEAFNELGHEIYNADLYQHQLTTDQQNLYCRVQAELVELAFYQDVELQLATPGTTYAMWFKDRGLTVESLSQYDAQLLANDILDKATGTDLSRQYTVKEIQTAMIALFTRLSSYTSQIIQSISASPLEPVGCPLIRAGDDETKERADDFIEISNPIVVEDNSKDRDLYPAEAIGIIDTLTITVKEREQVQIDAAPSQTLAGVGRERQRVELSDLRWSVNE